MRLLSESVRVTCHARVLHSSLSLRGTSSCRPLSPAGFNILSLSGAPCGRSIQMACVRLTLCFYLDTNIMRAQVYFRPQCHHSSHHAFRFVPSFRLCFLLSHKLLSLQIHVSSLPTRHCATGRPCSTYQNERLVAYAYIIISQQHCYHSICIILQQMSLSTPTNRACCSKIKAVVIASVYRAVNDHDTLWLELTRLHQSSVAVSIRGFPIIWS
ncbi:hypothetical protein BKA58DRAFT_383594 [Alternaria rosae]|uniref:uncharacterized protein n=1 Tax=Alternaria rosae TaxID=1187941 RepID=UPI001E8DC5BE|nr:uncharacterized protein BKA58DRAFT_383594 [Alternaria rosae]KAH6873169.1 hypothetical protein BKA58DRAFT_383594 [Alternaria rosae]